MGYAAQAEGWLARMTEKGVVPDLVTYGTLCKAFAREGSADKIEATMRRLESTGMALNEYFFASLISACGEAEPPDVARAERAFEEMVARGFRPQSVKKALWRALGERRTGELLEESGQAGSAHLSLGSAAPRSVQRRAS